MKKLFLSAALAIVAIGGAVSVKATTYYGSGGTPVFNCIEEAQLDCSSISVDIWESPNGQTPENRVEKSELVTQYNP